MSEHEEYPAGVPCWVETLQPDPRVALDFYGPLTESERRLASTQMLACRP